jgi:hypothetical protein
MWGLAEETPIPRVSDESVVVLQKLGVDHLANF